MKLEPRYLLIVFLIFIAAAVAVGVWGILYGWPPVIRNHYYWELVGDFQRAQSKAEIQDGDEKGGWDFRIQIPGSTTTAQVQAPSSVGIATIKYSDEGATRNLYEYADYTSPEGIRIAENILYVQWVNPLFGPRHWILAYDLVGRREITRRRIDPGDLGWSP
ncbi:MAG TPA: hypothetical protein VFK65_23640 [Candidatus Binatia bacterium]|nr:hypothetical protein [Candidatus Binatia bacterium]